ncbi:uncharacterized protein LOC116267247 [Nymphaea colorata]|nr:uncharacterized protein LOC116267247 [Nymphaea colorata]XP_031504731.1 uncharacterized protein LOC116267247 [Nymphaea colorata]
MKTTLLAGSYERFVWGFDLKTLKLSGTNHEEGEGGTGQWDEKKVNPRSHSLLPLFSYPSHNSSVRSVAACGSVAVTGGSDDTIKIFDLSSLSEIGSLIHHTGVITSLAFFSLTSSPSVPLNLFSGSTDGTINIYDTDPFVHLKSMKAHKRGVNDLTVHPSGRLALSVGHDSCICMFNLINGRRSFNCRLQKESEIIRYDSKGETFFMVAGQTISLHNAEDAKLIGSIENPNRVLCVAPAEGGLLFMGSEDGKLRAWDTTAGTMAYCIDDAHAARVKGLTILGSKGEGGDPSYMVATASSDGVVKVWDMRMFGNGQQPLPLAQAETKSRLTCLAGCSVMKI